MAQWKRAGPITQRSVDRNYALLVDFFHLVHLVWICQSGALHCCLLAALVVTVKVVTVEVVTAELVTVKVVTVVAVTN